MKHPRNRPVGVAALLLLAACDNPPISDVIPDDSLPNVFQAAVSEPVGNTASLTAASATAGAVYVAFKAGELGNAHTVRIDNISAGIRGNVVYLLDGALDPVAIQANIGDTLELRTTTSGGTTTLMRAVVPSRRPPRVIRVDPPKGRNDVALNARIIVIFSEPVDRNTITTGTIRLSLGGQIVPGQFSFRDPDGLAAEFTPAAALSPASSYTVDVATNIRDLSGDQLEEPLTTGFSTTRIGTNDIRVTATTTGINLPESYVVTLLSDTNDQSSIPANGVATFTNVAWNPTDAGIGFFVFLSELPDHCTVSSGNPRWATLPPSDAAADIRFAVLCEDRSTTQRVTTQQIAFVRGQDIRAINLNGTDDVRVANVGNNGDPAWSPDGNRLAFVSDRAGASHLYVMNADGSGVTPYGNGEFAVAPAWSRDGSKIAFGSNCNGQACILVVDANNPGGGSSVRLGHPQGVNTDPTWSPDGSKIAFMSDWIAFDIVYDIYIGTVDGPTITQLTNGFGFWKNLKHFLHPAWSPDGNKIAFVYGTIINDADMRFTLAVMDADGANRRDIARAGDIPWVELLDPGSLTWSPDGSRIAFTFVDCDLVTRTGCSGLRSIKAVNADGTNETVIVSNAHSPSWR